jgi:hypothetical protein
MARAQAHLRKCVSLHEALWQRLHSWMMYTQANKGMLCPVCNTQGSNPAAPFAARLVEQFCLNSFEQSAAPWAWLGCSVCSTVCLFVPAVCHTCRAGVPMHGCAVRAGVSALRWCEELGGWLVDPSEG